jgi:hypothetical protein
MEKSFISIMCRPIEHCSIFCAKIFHSKERKKVVHKAIAAHAQSW